MLSVIYAILFYVATLILVVGVAMKIRRYARIPAPLKIPTTPAPLTGRGVVARMFREIVFFESLFKANKWIWLFGWTFHMGLWLVLIRHVRYFVHDIPGWLAFAQPFGTYAGFAMLGGLLGLWARRFVVERIRYISGPSDHLMLALLVAIAGSGLLMRFVARPDIIALKVYMLSLLRFRIEDLPVTPILLIHLGLVATLMIVFPISKLLHAPGVFFSPTRNQIDNSREKRHLAAWAARLEG